MIIGVHMFGLFKSKTKNLDSEFRDWTLTIIQDEFQKAAVYLNENGLEMDASADLYIGGYIAGLVDGTFQIANEGANRESVLVTTKAVFQKLYNKEGGESLFHLVTNGIVNREESYILAYEKAIKDHNWHKGHNIFPPTLSGYLIAKAFDGSPP